MNRWQGALSAYLYATASVAVAALLFDVCYGWDDACRKVTDSGMTRGLCVTAVLAGLAGALGAALRGVRARRSVVALASLVHVLALAALVRVCALPLGKPGYVDGFVVHRHEPTPTAVWSWQNALHSADKRAVWLVVLSAALSVAGGALASAAPLRTVSRGAPSDLPRA